MAKYKIGDRVKIWEPSAPKGTGVIVKLTYDNFVYRVRHDEHIHKSFAWYVNESNMCLVDPIGSIKTVEDIEQYLFNLCV